ncbi:MAG: leucine--tRNA ligase [Alphaproteobacteria bacterium]|nr:leucine--tRNA ligase [Alphaproteobacteria bacterium]
MSDSYSPITIEKSWQARWRESGVFATRQTPGKPRFFAYEYPPFPSGELHMGHVRNYTIGDTVTRYKRLQGYNVLYTQGFDSLGLPVEDAAIKVGKTPAQWLDECIEKMTDELFGLGLSYDAEKIFSYHDPEYYKWTQWIFLKLFEAGAIYRSKQWSDWCETCITALAFEQVEDGRCWRCKEQTTKTQQEQWYIDVHSVAPELLDGLETFDFPPSAKVLQRNWIGCLPGLFVEFPIEGSDTTIEVFTTKVSAIYGTTFIGLAPEHPDLPDLVTGTPDADKVLAALRDWCTTPLVERMKDPGAEGIFLDRYCTHPLTGERIPLCVAPYVQADLGTGAILGCPAHDTNAHRFAVTMGLPIKTVISPGVPETAGSDAVYLGEGHLVDSGCHSGLASSEAETAIAQDLIDREAARKGETYRVRDWCISRQRYWSAPIPIIHCDHCGPVAVPEADLPVLLPTEGVDMTRPGNPLEHHERFMATQCPACGRPARREASTLDTFVNSSWSYMRNCNPHYHDGMYDPDAVTYWVPCDFDIGGTENITVANFYFRVVLKWLDRLGLTPMSEPFKSSIFHGMVLKDGRKMSKSLGNVVRPTDLIAEYGVDSVRFQSMWAARPDSDYNWSDEKAAAARRFLTGVWYGVLDLVPVLGQTLPNMDGDPVMTNADKKFANALHVGSGKIQAGYERIEFQAVCNDLMLLWDKLKKYSDRVRAHATRRNIELLRRAVEQFLIMLNPIAPHLTEELWGRLGNPVMLAQSDHWRDRIGQDRTGQETVGQERVAHEH